MQIVNFLAGFNCAGARVLAEEAARMHPQSEEAKKRLAELSAGS